MGWSLLSGHYCDPEYVVAGHCPRCGTEWNKNDSDWDLTKKALRGTDVRNEKGERFPLL